MLVEPGNKWVNKWATLKFYMEKEEIGGIRFPGFFSLGFYNEIFFITIAIITNIPWFSFTGFCFSLEREGQVLFLVSATRALLVHKRCRWSILLTRLRNFWYPDAHTPLQWYSWVIVQQVKQANMITMSLILFIFVFMPYIWTVLNKCLRNK